MTVKIFVCDKGKLRAEEETERKATLNRVFTPLTLQK